MKAKNLTNTPAADVSLADYGESKFSLVSLAKLSRLPSRLVSKNDGEIKTISHSHFTERENPPSKSTWRTVIIVDFESHKKKARLVIHQSSFLTLELISSLIPLVPLCILCQVGRRNNNKEALIGQTQYRHFLSCCQVKNCENP